MPTKRSLALLVAAATTVAVAAPALADTSVPVTVVGVGGTRQFAVEDVTGAPLTALNLGTGGAQPFRTHVTDSSFVPAALGGNYDVSASLSNLYLKTGSGSSASDYNFNVKVPSSDVAIGFGSNPLAISGLSLADLPKLSISGSLASCLNLDNTLKGILGLSPAGAVLNGNTALSTLCTTLGVLGSPVAATVDGQLQTLTPSLTDLTAFPTALSGATGGTFTNPSYAAGVGALDTAGAAAATSQATSVPLMKGTTAATLAPSLVSDLLGKLTALSSPLTTATGSGALAQTSAVVAALQASTTPVVSQLGAVLVGLSAAQQSSALNDIFTTLTPLAPVLADLQGVTGSSFAFPVLRATPKTPVPGTYAGTLTVTFVQS